MSQIADMNSFKKEMTDVEDAFLNATGQEMARYYRPPRGNNTANLIWKWLRNWDIRLSSGASHM